MYRVSLLRSTCRVGADYDFEFLCVGDMSGAAEVLVTGDLNIMETDVLNYGAEALRPEHKALHHGTMWMTARHTLAMAFSSARQTTLLMRDGRDALAETEACLYNRRSRVRFSPRKF